MQSSAERGLETHLMPPPYGKGDEWHLYNLKEDIKEENNLAGQFPEKFIELKEDWKSYALSIGYIKSNGESALRKLGFKEFYRFNPKHRLEQNVKTKDAGSEDVSPTELGD